MQDKDICVCTEPKDLAPPMACAAEMFQLLPFCDVAVDEISWERKQRVERRCVQLCRYMPIWVLECHLGPGSGSWGGGLSMSASASGNDAGLTFRESLRWCS